MKRLKRKGNSKRLHERERVCEGIQNKGRNKIKTQNNERDTEISEKKAKRERVTN